MYNLLIAVALGLVVTFGVRAAGLPWYAGLIPGVLAFGASYIYLARRIALKVQAITTEAQKYKDIRTQHRTGKGPFVAVLRLWKEVDKYEVREVDTIAVRCKNKAAAIEAARRLLAENAHRFDDGVSVEAEVLASLEWEADPDKEVADA